MQSAEDYNARAPYRGLKMKSQLEFLAEHTEKGGSAAVYPHPPIVVSTGSQRPRCTPRRAKNIESTVFGCSVDLKREPTGSDGGDVKKTVIDSFPPRPPIHNNTLGRRPKMTTNLTVTCTKKCQGFAELHQLPDKL